MTTNARELAEKLVKDKYKIFSTGSGQVFFKPNEENEFLNEFGIAWILATEIELAYQRGRESVLSRVPSEDEVNKAAQGEMSFGGVVVNHNTWIWQNAARWVIAKLKEPT